ncbi:hypothetical protein [Desulfosoma sp.]|uniref:hypothetical protein n=1 Tax=Desulfosoma sp. TaxID=2603217 RepID=UPI00404B7258
MGSLVLTTAGGAHILACAEKDPHVEVVVAGIDRMIVDDGNREARISCDVTKDASKPAVVNWGGRFQAWLGIYGGKMEGWFVFTTV